MKLGELEKEIMQIVWSEFPDHSFTVRHIVDAFTARKREYAYNTVLTVITHLFEKRLLRRKKQGKTFLYTTEITQEEFVKNTSKEFVTTLQEEFGDVAIAYFANALADIDPAVLKRAKSQIDSIKK